MTKKKVNQKKKEMMKRTTLETFPTFTIKRKDDFVVVDFKPVGEMMHYDDPRVIPMLAECLQPLLAHAREQIKTRMPDSGWYQSFSAANITTKNVIIENFSFALFVERDEEREGYGYLGFSALTPLYFMMSSHYYMAKKRESLMEYLSSLEAQATILKSMKDLMENLMRSAYGLD